MDNYLAHKPPIRATMWQHGHMQGYNLSNVLVIYFEPSHCTSHVQPLDAGCIQIAKALYRERQMTWVLQKILQFPSAGKPQVKYSIRQTIEWFISSTHSIPAGNSPFQITPRHYVVDDHAMCC
jgi:hypothetical protein